MCLGYVIFTFLPARLLSIPYDPDWSGLFMNVYRVLRVYRSFNLIRGKWQKKRRRMDIYIGGLGKTYPNLNTYIL